MFFFFQQDTENLECKCTSVIPTEVIFKKDGSEYTLSSKGIYINNLYIKMKFRERLNRSAMRTFTVVFMKMYAL